MLYSSAQSVPAPCNSEWNDKEVKWEPAPGQPLQVHKQSILNAQAAIRNTLLNTSPVFPLPHIYKISHEDAAFVCPHIHSRDLCSKPISCQWIHCLWIFKIHCLWILKFCTVPFHWNCTNTSWSASYHIPHVSQRSAGCMALLAH